MKGFVKTFSIWLCIVALCILASALCAGAEMIPVADVFAWLGLGGLCFGTTLSVTHPTLLDLKKAGALDEKGGAVAEIAAQTNEVLLDMVFLEGNLTTGHRGSIRTGYPEPTWRKMNEGVQPAKSTYVQVTDNCGQMTAYSQVDKTLADLAVNRDAFRLNEDRGHIEGFNQKLSTYVFYGNEGTEPESITGFAPRFNDQTAENGGNILTSAATPDSTDNASIWLVVWGPNTVHGIYPRGSKGGLQVVNQGEVTAQNVNGVAGAMMQAYQTYYEWNVGMHVKDWRYIVRINFDLEDIVAAATTGPDLSALMRKAARRIPSLNMGRPAWYANRDVLDAMDLQFNARTNLNFKTVEESDGKLVDTFLKIPIRRCDALLSNEAGI